MKKNSEKEILYVLKEPAWGWYFGGIFLFSAVLFFSFSIFFPVSLKKDRIILFLIGLVLFVIFALIARDLKRRRLTVSKDKQVLTYHPFIGKKKEFHVRDITRVKARYSWWRSDCITLYGMKDEPLCTLETNMTNVERFYNDLRRIDTIRFQFKNLPLLPPYIAQCYFQDKNIDVRAYCREHHIDYHEFMRETKLNWRKWTKIHGLQEWE